MSQDLKNHILKRVTVFGLLYIPKSCDISYISDQSSSLMLHFKFCTTVVYCFITVLWWGYQVRGNSSTLDKDSNNISSALQDLTDLAVCVSCLPFIIELMYKFRISFRFDGPVLIYNDDKLWFINIVIVVINWPLFIRPSFCDRCNVIYRVFLLSPTRALQL